MPTVRSEITKNIMKPVGVTPPRMNTRVNAMAMPTHAIIRSFLSDLGMREKISFIITDYMKFFSHITVDSRS